MSDDLPKLLDEMRLAVAQRVEQKAEYAAAYDYLQNSGWANDATWARHLRANKLNAADAAKSLLHTTAWRVDFKVDQLDSSKLQHVMKPRTFFLSNGRDRAGRPIVITFKPDGPEDPDYASSIQNIVYQLEKASASMPPGQEKWIWIMDLAKFSYFNATPISVVKQTIEIFSKMFPERLHRAIIVDAPWAFRAIWKVISAFIDPVTSTKICFLENRDSAEFKESIGRDIDLDQLEPFLGGTSTRPYSSSDELDGVPLIEVRHRLTEQAKLWASSARSSGEGAGEAVVLANNAVASASGGQA